MARTTFPPQVLVPVADEDGCYTGKFAVNVVVIDPVVEGWTLGEDLSGPLVQLFDADGCVVGWVLKTVQLVEE